MPPLHSAARGARLVRTFWEVVKGEKSISGINAKQFLEACNYFCQQQGPVKWVEVIISNPAGLPALHLAIHSNVSTGFVTSTILPLLGNLSDGRIETLNDGKFLEQLITAVLVPSTFWDSLLSAHMGGFIPTDGQEVFAWVSLCIASSQSLELETHRGDVERIMTTGKSLLESPSHKIRSIAYRIEKIIRTRSEAGVVSKGVTPGGRHDNDFADFRLISIYPTTDEFLSSEEPFLQRLDDAFEVPMDRRAQTHLDWLFRLLREDMIGELREDLNVAMGIKKGRRAPIVLGDMNYVGVDSGIIGRTKPCAIQVSCGQGINLPRTMSEDGKRRFLNESKSFLKHKALGALCSNTHILAFGFLDRNVDLLLKKPPVIGIQFVDSVGLRNALTALRSPDARSLRFLLVDTATFAYEPILQRLKEVIELPLGTQLISATDADQEFNQPHPLQNLLDDWKLRYDEKQEVLVPASICSKPIRLRGAQLHSLINGLSGELSQIQGPPGTGKSFIGALMIRILIRLTTQKVLVLSYTNHALDQFIEDLVDIGIQQNDVVRLGSKSTSATAATRLDTYSKHTKYRLKQEEWDIIKQLKQEAAEVKMELEELSSKLRPTSVRAADILDFLEFSDDDYSYFAALQVPEDDDFQVVGANNKTLTSEDMYDYWLRDAAPEAIGNLASSLNLTSHKIWQLPLSERRDLDAKWSAKVRQELISTMAERASRSDDLQRRIDSIFNQSKRRVLEDKRVIACTTTAAAMYQSIIKSAHPDVVMVEEAGEILEAHIITALSPSVKQLILIGDHKQLRPKVNNFKLTIEKGEGYDLNVSLFERLIRQGHAFTTLQEQHRSHPDISHFTRTLAYPELEDNAKTKDRQPIRGLPSRVVFVHHEKPEVEMPDVGERRDPTANGSKRNVHEAQMVLKMVKYLAQQGYKTENMVVLTPYLGQLALLKDTLVRDNDPYLNDLDSHDLIRAGLLQEAAAKANKKPLRLSTIDNYQGEESDIVIASLTRSNAKGDIGFLQARERLVVLMSRARNGIILFGNMLTFKKSKKGGEMWSEYFTSMEQKNCLFDGVPVKCERHPGRAALLKTPEDFDKCCPEGGCEQICGAQLSCVKHKCQRKCHKVKDHSKIACKAPEEWTCDKGHKSMVSCDTYSRAVCKTPVEWTCRNGHKSIVRCFEVLSTVCKQPSERTCERGHKVLIPCSEPFECCITCVEEDKESRRRAARDFQMERERYVKQEEYRHRLQEVEDEIDRHRRAMQYKAEEEDQENTILKKQRELKDIINKREKNDRKKLKADQDALNRANGSSSSQEAKKGYDPDPSSARDEWEAMKRNEGAENEEIDKLMGMIGLETIKDQFLSIKSSIDTKIRQGVSLSEERFSCTLLGNPGTGKTTVARIWAKFLSTIGAIPGDTFEETTGSKLANDGVKGCEKLLEHIKNAKGGVLFIDEAYQLSSGNSPGGKAVLDFLLAEVENLRGKVVFVLAGYSRQMESFFSHNPGFPSRFPIEMKFEDYTDDELLKILQLQVHRIYKGRMKVQDGVGGLFFRIASRRVGFARGKEGFGNARAVENALASIQFRQAKRLRRERWANKNADDLMLTQEDIIGPEPSSTLAKSQAFKELNSLIGLDKVKANLQVMMDTLKTNYGRELAEEPLVEFSLNRLFLGSPGTGKTTVAKLFGQALVDLGLLSNGEVIIKNPADFVGAHIGESEAQTKAILGATAGKVLVIDEAYGLWGGSGSGAGHSDVFRSAVVDTIVSEIQSVPGEDRCVLLLGYRDQMEEMLQKVNPGLSRRFPLSTAFVFEDFDEDALSKILDLKLSKSGFKATDEAKRVALEVLRRARNRPHFGNAGEIDILLGQAMSSHQQRRTTKRAKRRALLEAVDFDADFDRADKRETNILKLFEGDIGREKIITQLQGYQERVQRFRSLDMDPEIPFSFLFRGPPGTGKTSTAKKMGKVYYDMGFLSAAEVIECSATDLIGKYVGHTGPKVLQLLDKALGRVLFIDEAYRLAPNGSGHDFAKEALDELVDSMTKERYKGKMIVILAGYEADINSLLSSNPGLTSRFPETMDFEVLSSKESIKLIIEQLERKQKELQKKGKSLDLACLKTPRDEYEQKLKQSIGALSTQDGWANARDVKYLAKKIFQDLDFDSDSIELTEETIDRNIRSMFDEREGRMKKKAKPTKASRSAIMEIPQAQPPQPPINSPNSSMSAATQVNKLPVGHHKQRPEVADTDCADSGSDSSDEEWTRLARTAARDIGVTDAVWEQLQKDIEEENREDAEYLKLLKAQKEVREADREKLIKQMIAEEDKRKQDNARKTKLMAGGFCPVGYHWIKQQGGYRCAGGSHWMADADVDKL